MSLDPVTAVLDIGGKIIDKIWPDKEEAAKARMELARLQREGQLRELESRYQAIIAEAQSDDPWTSRARPAFLYVMYLLLLAAIPYGLASIFAPAETAVFVMGFEAWFNAIPSELYTLFGAGYLGYGAMRSMDKTRLFKKKE